MLATADDMRARFTEAKLVQLTDRPAWDAQCVAAINVQIATASAIVVGYVAAYYAPAPDRAVPVLLTEIVCDLAYARLHVEPSEAVQKRASDAEKRLDKIANGLIKIDEGKQDLPARDGAVIVPDRERTFSRDRLGGF